MTVIEVEEIIVVAASVMVIVVVVVVAAAKRSNINSSDSSSCNNSYLGNYYNLSVGGAMDKCIITPLRLTCITYPVT